ncbi:ABC transporter ATP-binding protein [Lactobacillus sp. ESL0791]|uniref:ATP-binding cassette domain-containing protein n=1 Tax=Lactobacillus sp. ESL0791 TaxID=2983234 RepID=UPI0023F7235E|nr:ABC transporter ATP-binding protein [Lactobacillus sp. ESL0791]MDF7639516.1 ABC transporter ATP-binding protein [Lactobacillus sp. ESL0791]
MTIKGFFKENPVRFILLFCGAVFVPAAAIGVTWLTALMTTAVKKWQPALAFWLAAVSAILFLANYLVQGWVTSLSAKQEEEYNVTLRRGINQHYFYDGADHKVAQVQNRLTNDLVQANEDYFAAWLNVIMGISFFVSVFILLVSFHWLLLVTVILMSVVSLILPKLLEKQLQTATIHLSEANKFYLDSLEKWLSGLAEIRRYLAGGKLFKVMQTSSKKLEDANVKQIGVRQILRVITGTVSGIFSFLLFVLAGWLITHNQVQFGVFIAVGNCQYYLSSSIQQIIGAYGQIKGVKTLRDKITVSASPVAKTEMKNVETPVALATSDLSLKFPNGESLVFPDIDVKKGEKILLTGDSGAGKTTLFKLLLGEIKPATGKVIFKDEAGQGIKPDLSKIGYIPQQPVLFPATIADNMTMFNAKLKQNLAPLVEKVQFADDVAKFSAGLDEEINLNKLNISGGQRQKIVLVRALVHQSEIILIDEGTSAIDQRATMEILRQVTKSDATVLFIAHSFNAEMKDLFDREIHLVKNKK